MFTRDQVAPCDHPVPLAELERDLGGAPSEGWSQFLGRRAVSLQPDDLGRDCVSRHDARLLLDEAREHELKRRKLLALQEAEFIEQDELRRAQLPKGTPWYEAVGLSAVEAMMQSDYANKPRSVRQQLLDDALAGGGSTMVYQPFQDDVGES